MGILTYNDTSFLLDGKPFTILSGAMHYFRIPRAYWHDRLLKLKECGFNTVETYTCWNLHEKKEGEFDFTDGLDLAAYADEAKALGLNMILRPGPYICAEWEFGGLPAWLLKEEEMALRCNDPRFLEKVRHYYEALFETLRPRLSTNGGNIFLVQIENEYGSYGSDKDYLRAIRQILRDVGCDVTLFTSDGTEPWMLEGGPLPDELCVANFGSDPKGHFAALTAYRQGQPTMCGEYWCGWFDHWYEQHHVRKPEELASLFRDMLEAKASLNFYMFHGGTNFGFMNGANCPGVYQPTVTSYDYNALLSEAGDMTPAYFAVRKTIEEFFGPLPPLTAKNVEKAAYGKVSLPLRASFRDAAKQMVKPVYSPVPVFQESIGQNWGYTLYVHTLHDNFRERTLTAETIHDRALFFLDGEKFGTFERSRKEDPIVLPEKHAETEALEILVENMGRTNYGPYLRDRKGITGVRFSFRFVFGWEIYPLEMTAEELARIEYRPGEGGTDEPTFFKGTLTIEGMPKDTFLRLDGFHHGFVSVNGINLGRYYNDAGPQKTLYCPAPFLREGDNEIVVFETDGTDRPEVVFTDTPDLG